MLDDLPPHLQLLGVLQLCDHQRESLIHIMNWEDTAIVRPTSSGKSNNYKYKLAPYHKQGEKLWKVGN